MVTKTSLIFVFLYFLIIYTFSIASAKPKSRPFGFASYYGDHMVLQKAPQRAHIWGYSRNPGLIVNILLNNKSVGQTQSVSGPVPFQPVWSILLPPIESGGPYRISATSSEGEITISDVLFGDVWLCSGQSNMQFTLDMAFNASEELADVVNHPDIRLFTVVLEGSLSPKYDLLNISENWSVPSKDTVGHSPWTYFSAVCWLYGKYLSSVLNYPIGLLATSYGGTPIEAWSSPDALRQCPHNPELLRTVKAVSGPPNPGTPSVLWNAMVRPLVNMTIYGTIWYQGEANSLPGTGTEVYSCRFPAMINDWRKKFSDSTFGQTSSMFPFGFVQLAPWRNNASQTDGFPEIRWHQTADYGYVPNDMMKNVFMSVAIDLPDFTSPYTGIHPRDKQDVAKRLYTEGLAVGYNMTGYTKLRGPFPSAVNKRSEADKTVIISYDDHDTTLDVRTSDGFEVCCIQTPASNPTTYCALSSDVWGPVKITNSDNTTVTLYYGDVCTTKAKPSIGAIRYAWRESPCEFKTCAIYNKLSGYPAPPFVKYVI